MPDTLLAIIPRLRLSDTLTAFHRDGYGHVTRVLDPIRASLANQLGRAGVQSSRLVTASINDAVLLFVHAPMRTTAAAALAVTNGALDVDLVTCGQPVAAAIAPGLMAIAEDRRCRRGSRPAESGQDAIADAPGYAGRPIPAEQ